MRADVVGKRLRVLGDVGGDAILTHAAVGQGIRIALVVGGGQGSNTGLLGADERALSALVLAPSICGVLDLKKTRDDCKMLTSVGLPHAVGVDGVWVVLLRRSLGGGKAGKGSGAEGNDRTHVDYNIDG